LRRRNGEEPVIYPGTEVEKVLRRTLGVPIFQEQVMKLAVVAAGFTPGEADQLRRAMAAWHRRGGLEHFEQRLIRGMRERGYSDDFAERIFNQIKGFGEYGFPESHAASFALLVYVSAWLKCHEPAIFCCALLNSQPMGFYAPAQLIRSAREHGVEVRPVDVLHSDWDSTIEAAEDGSLALRLGLRLVKGLSQEGVGRLLAARARARFIDIQGMAEEAGLDSRELGALAAAGALGSMTRNRHDAAWRVAGVQQPAPLLRGTRITEGLPMLRAPTEGEDIAADYRHWGASLGRHPLALLRGRFQSLGLVTAREVSSYEPGSIVRTVGLVITRQRPGSASGVVFVTLEDETGYLNLIIWERVAMQQRAALHEAALLGVRGKIQKEGEVLHVVADRLHDYSALLGSLETRSRDFR
ncbi:MAG TPA: OB-fold nucleic acid binding domain-containing protein, partial [Gammaproteobacteria bacterium]|nr:OB-fold nucleic acid binding domain-containing protein [Gammaproteobacteria bacterium]